MALVGLLAGLGASFFWALGGMLAHRPARALGAFEFTRIQLVACATLLAALVTAGGGWSTVSAGFAGHFVVASVIGVIGANLAMVACLRRGGPRRTQLLLAMSAPISTVLAGLVLGETLSSQKLAGVLVATAGILVAILFGPASDRDREPVAGSLAMLATWGLLAAMSKAIGFIALKPVLAAGTDPLAAAALRTGAGALLVVVAALWPASAFSPRTPPTGRLVLAAILPGILGYVVATALQLQALQIHEAAVVAVLSSAAPVMILPMIWLATGRAPSPPAWCGAGAVMAGSALLALA